MGRSRLLRAPSQCFVSSLKLRTVRRITRGVPFPSLPSPGGSSPPTRLLILEVTSPVSRHPRIHGNIRNSSVSLSTQTCSLRAGRWRGFPSQEVRPTSSRHTGVGGIRLFWDSASDGPPSEGGAIPSELLGAESRITPLPCSISCGPSLLSHLRREESHSFPPLLPHPRRIGT